MPACYIYVWLFIFTAFASDMLNVTVKMGLNNRVELKGKYLDQKTIKSLKEMEWTKHFWNKSCLCLRFVKLNNSSTVYSNCCGKADFYLNNNSLVLENMTAQDGIVFNEKNIEENGRINTLRFVLTIVYPPKAIEIVVSWRCNNTSVSFTCKVNGTYTDIMWKRNYSPFLKNNKHSFSENNRTLHISNITHLDYGTYSCTVATLFYGTLEMETNIANECLTHGENSTANGKHQIGLLQTALPSGLTIGISGLCIILFYCIKTCSQSHREEAGRTTEEGDVDPAPAIYQEVPGAAEVSSLPYVYTDFIKPREANENSASATENTEDFGYSEIGPAFHFG